MDHNYDYEVPSGATFIRLTIRESDADDCYIYNITRNTYLWKGKNVNN